MAASPRALGDDDARRAAIAVHDRSFLVEAGAGSGKTAVLAGRIAMLLAEGIAPRSIAAVTFTVFAASELLIRVREFVGVLVDGDIPTPLRVALPDGLSESPRRNLAAASEALDEITCSTIHGFCQRLITPYQVEADIDPGAAVMDRDQGALAFREITDAWLREELTGEVDGLLAELVLRNPDGTVALIRTILDHLRRHRPRGAGRPGAACRRIPGGGGRVQRLRVRTGRRGAGDRRHRTSVPGVGRSGRALPAATNAGRFCLAATHCAPSRSLHADRGLSKVSKERKVACGGQACGFVPGRW